MRAPLTLVEKGRLALRGRLMPRRREGRLPPAAPPCIRPCQRVQWNQQRVPLHPVHPPGYGPRVYIDAISEGDTPPRYSKAHLLLSPEKSVACALSNVHLSAKGTSALHLFSVILASGTSPHISVLMIFLAPVCTFPCSSYCTVYPEAHQRGRGRRARSPCDLKYTIF